MRLLLVVVEGIEPIVELDEPDNNMEAAAEVVEAMAVAESGRVWLCVPS